MYKNIASLMLGGALVFGTASCTDKFEDFNTDPKNPTVEQMEGDFAYTATLIGNMVPIVALGQENDFQMIDQMIGCEYGHMMAASNNWGTDGMFGNYNPRIGWQGIPFTTLMPKYMYTPFFQIRDVSSGEGLVYHWANILRIYGTQRVSDCYGPTPFSMIGGGDSFQVEYDDTPDLYNYMFEELDKSIAVLKTAVGGTVSSTLQQADVVYGGDIAKWVKFANTLKLRMAMRIVNANPNLAKQKAEEAANDPGGLVADATDAAWSSYIPGGNALQKTSELWGEGRVSADITAYMNGYNDPRLPILVAPAADGSFNGARQGVYRYQTGFSTYSLSTTKSDSKLLSMAACESWFLRAEGALRGWNMGGQSAKEYYETGVQVSMNERGASIGNYLEGTDGPANYTATDNTAYSVNAQTTICPKYDESASFETNLERIIVQKWLGNFPNGWESWADFRRTGYPKWFPIYENRSTDGVTTSRGMRRIPFPQSEFNTNEANVKKAIQMLGGPDTGATDLWWCKKN
ncbi:MAG: SusD/RagB family nutrient-binding outer membrane lipoprotein [Bacteroides sp.]|nr:SusD/RagB family nutrient-binding outer membrane lipoprotein [Bacteroides sp.]